MENITISHEKLTEGVIGDSTNSTLNEQKELEFWKNLNRQCCDQESVVSAGSWIEADKTGY
jgi:hypothetical protein